MFDWPFSHPHISAWYKRKWTTRVCVWVVWSENIFRMIWLFAVVGTYLHDATCIANGHRFCERQKLLCFDCVLFEFQLTFRSIDSDLTGWAWNFKWIGKFYSVWRWISAELIRFCFSFSIPLENNFRAISIASVHLESSSAQRSQLQQELSGALAKTTYVILMNKHNPCRTLSNPID